MRDIKIKPDMDKPKALTKNFTPKDSVSLQQKKLEQQKTGKEPESKDGVRYATDKTEHGMRDSALTAADASRRMVKQYRSDHKERADAKHREVEQTTPPNIPSGNATTAKSVPVPNADEPPVASPQSVHQSPRSGKAAPQERGRQKAIRDAKEKTTLRRDLAGNKTADNRYLEQPVIRERKAVVLQKNAGSLRKTNAPKGGTVSATGKHSTKSASLRPSVYHAKIFAQRRAQQKMLQTTARKTKNTAHKLGGMTVRAGKSAGRAAVSTASSITALGGAMVLVLLLTVILVAAIVASPFGILFSGESRGPGTVPISAAVAQVNYDFNAELEALQTAEDYDTITVTGQAADWVEILAVFAVKVAGSDTDAADVATIDADRIDRLKAVFWDMTTIEHEVEVIHHPGTEDGEGWTERNLYITISTKTVEEMKTAYHFNRHQLTALEELLAQQELLLELIEDTYAISTDTAKLLRNLPDDLSPEREAVVRTACSLVGKVNYFWGGKSSVIGWDSRWGTLVQVTAAGSPTTGTYRPYGLDCSGCATRS